MKKWLSILVAVLLVLSSVTAFAEAPIPSKTTSDLTDVLYVVPVDGDVTLPDDFVVAVGTDTVMTVEEVEKLYEHAVTEGDPIILYFPEETQQEVLDKVQEMVGDEKVLTIEDLYDWTIEEIFSVDVANYEDAFGDIIVGFEFATPYEVGQKMVGLLGVYDGTRTEVAPNEFEFNVVWYTLDAEVVETVVDEENEEETKSIVNVTFTKDALLAMEEAVANTMAILSEPMPAEAEK